MATTPTSSNEVIVLKLATIRLQNVSNSLCVSIVSCVCWEGVFAGGGGGGGLPYLSFECGLFNRRPNHMSAFVLF